VKTSRFFKIPPQNRQTGVQNSEFGVKSFGFGVQNSEFGVKSLDFGVRNSEFGVKSSGVGVQNSELGVKSSGFGVRNPEQGAKSFGFEGLDIGRQSESMGTLTGFRRADSKTTGRLTLSHCLWF